MYSNLPGGMEALPKFDESDFKIPSDTAASISCFGVTRTLETESSESDSESPRHSAAADEKRRVKRSSSQENSGHGFFGRMRSQKPKPTNGADINGSSEERGCSFLFSLM